jgi:hypothetical protein
MICRFVCYIGIAYQLPGAVAGERAGLLTSHMKAMGLLDSARIMCVPLQNTSPFQELNSHRSWLLSISLPYLPAWIIVGIVWRYRIFSETNVLMIIAVHLLLPLSLASWSLVVAAPFGKSPQLAAVVSTFLAILFAIVALVFGHAHDGAAVIFTLIFPPGFYIFAIRAIAGWENHLHPTNALKPDPDNGLRLLPLMIIALVSVYQLLIVILIGILTIIDLPI